MELYLRMEELEKQVSALRLSNTHLREENKKLRKQNKKHVLRIRLIKRYISRLNCSSEGYGDVYEVAYDRGEASANSSVVNVMNKIFSTSHEYSVLEKKNLPTVFYKWERKIK